MKSIEGVILEATMQELYTKFWQEEWDNVMSFKDFVKSCKEQGVIITDE